MKIGVTGHQYREGIEWPWVARAVHAELKVIPNVEKALSSLAAGADQVFAEAALSLGIRLVAVIPIDDYEQYFDTTALATYRRLLAQSEVVHLGWKGDPSRSFLEAGRFIVNGSDLMFAVWDGASAEGVGGTADIVRYTGERGRALVHINPFNRTVTHSWS